jgi:hypothetical protein
MAAQSPKLRSADRLQSPKVDLRTALGSRNLRPLWRNLPSWATHKMRHVIYYSLMLILGFAFYKYGQNLLHKAPGDGSVERTKGVKGAFGLLVMAGVNFFLLFLMLRALALREVECLGKGCKEQLYTLAANAAEYWSSMFYLLWMVLGLSYAMYVTLKIRSREQRYGKGSGA